MRAADNGIDAGSFGSVEVVVENSEGVTVVTEDDAGAVVLEDDAGAVVGSD